MERRTEDAHHRVAHVDALERQCEREDLVEDDTERPNVRAHVELRTRTLHLLGRHVLGRAGVHLRTGLVFAGRSDDLSEAPIDDDRLVEVTDNDVRWFEIGVQDRA